MVRILCPTPELLFVSLSTLVFVNFTDGISHLASLVFSLIWFFLDLGLLIGK